MKILLFITCYVALLNTSVAVPRQDVNPHDGLEDIIEYERYLMEVVQLLESDKDFKKKLETSDEDFIRSGKIAHELELVSHHIRSKLDELKRKELERLRSLSKELFEKSNGIDREHLKIVEHIDHTNELSFEVNDLKKLMFKTTASLAEADRLRREEFKQYELEKEFEKQEKLRSLDEENRKEYEEEIEAMTEKHKKHEKIHHPGSKDQFEEVWVKQDHMDRADYNPHIFFMLHDVNGDGYWDETELKAIFKIELDKVYSSDAPEDDMREREEEMERMREHVFKEADMNGDRLINYAEFMAQTVKLHHNQDIGWKTIDEQEQFTHEEYLEFEKRKMEEYKRMREARA